MFGATNEVPDDDDLGALFDRFLICALADKLDSFHFAGLIERDNTERNCRGFKR